MLPWFSFHQFDTDFWIIPNVTTICQRSPEPIYIVSYNLKKKMDRASLTYSILFFVLLNFFCNKLFFLGISDTSCSVPIVQHNTTAINNSVSIHLYFLLQKNLNRMFFAWIRNGEKFNKLWYFVRRAVSLVCNPVKNVNVLVLCTLRLCFMYIRILCILDMDKEHILTSYQF